MKATTKKSPRFILKDVWLRLSTNSEKRSAARKNADCFIDHFPPSSHKLALIPREGVEKHIGPDRKILCFHPFSNCEFFSTFNYCPGK